MAIESREKRSEHRKRLAEMKKKLLSMPIPERVVEEVRLARELGITVTASEAGAIGRPIERRSRVETPSPANTIATIPANVLASENSREYGLGTDLRARESAAGILKTSAFTQLGLAAHVREGIKKLRDGDMEEIVSRISPQLELLVARGEAPELIRQAKDAFADTVFAAANSSKSKKGMGGTPNRQ